MIIAHRPPRCIVKRLITKGWPMGQHGSERNRISTAGRLSSSVSVARRRSSTACLRWRGVANLCVFRVLRRSP
jgi:hypothetical protein